ncbi:RluA family pseudouridine synthase [Candidatus Daviesbacteria bacterium]|nr:RluA family pseudouridine synthase [Candidatus Daviesbacteria bacterium]
MINVLFQDDQLLVIEKPAGLVVAPSQTQHEMTLSEILQSDFGINLERGGIVHRLDKDTSGVMLVAKTEASFGALQAQFKSRQVEKEYLTLVHGFVTEPGVIEGAIGRNPRNREKFTILDEGKEASTAYEPLKLLLMDPKVVEEIFADFSKIQFKKLSTMNYSQFTLIKASPKTGRTHQIRVHLKHIGHSIVGDDKYGGRKLVRLDHRWCTRQFLHAAKINFNHPVTGERMTFTSRLPEDLEKALKKLSEVVV